MGSIPTGKRTETTGTGAAAFDYDGDGWIDTLLVNGTTLEGFPAGEEPTNHLYRNKGNLTFEDVTARAGLAQGGWGQGACAGDYDNDGDDDSFVTYWAKNRLYRNKGDGAFEETTARAGLTQARTRWGAGRAFLDYNRDGLLDIVVANYIDSDSQGDAGFRPRGRAATRPAGPHAGLRACRAARTCSIATVGRARSRTCPRRQASRPRATYGWASTVDFDNDGWLDVYVANDSILSGAYHNNRNGTFTDIGIAAGRAYSQHGKPQAGMGVAIGDYDRNGTLDIFKTQLCRRHLDALRQHRQGRLRGSHVCRRHRPQHVVARLGRRVRLIPTTAAGSISFSSTDTCIRKSIASRPKRATSSARWSTGT